MADKKASPRTFKAWSENEERLEFAENKGLNVSEVINEVLSKYLKPTLETKHQEDARAISRPGSVTGHR